MLSWEKRPKRTIFFWIDLSVIIRRLSSNLKEAVYPLISVWNDFYINLYYAHSSQTLGLYQSIIDIIKVRKQKQRPAIFCKNQCSQTIQIMNKGQYGSSFVYAALNKYQSHTKSLLIDMEFHIHIFRSPQGPHNLLWSESKHKQKQIVKLICPSNINQRTLMLEFISLYRRIIKQSIKTVKIFASDLPHCMTRQQKDNLGSVIDCIVSQINYGQRFIQEFQLQGSHFLSDDFCKRIAQPEWKFINKLIITNSYDKIGKLNLENMNLKYLTYLDLNGNYIDDASLSAITRRSFNWLQHFDASGNIITTKGVKYLSQVDWPRLKKLVIDRMRFSSVVFKYLAKMHTSSNIELKISIQNCPFKATQIMPTLPFDKIEVNVYKFYPLFGQPPNYREHHEHFYMMEKLANTNSIVKNQTFGKKISDNIDFLMETFVIFSAEEFLEDRVKKVADVHKDYYWLHFLTFFDSVQQ